MSGGVSGFYVGFFKFNHYIYIFVECRLKVMYWCAGAHKYI